MREPIIRINSLSKEFYSDSEAFYALENINLEIFQGDFVAIVGASGSGKTTLLNILGCMDKPSSGEYWLDGQNITTLSINQLAEIRRESFGFIFQKYNLISDLSAVENVEIPAVYAGQSDVSRKEQAVELLQILGLGDRLNHFPHQLSGGQQQRVGIARALINKGKILLADEPTGALDSHNGTEILNIIRNLNQSGYTIIMVTHDMALARQADTIVTLKDSQIIDIQRSAAAHEEKKQLDQHNYGKYNNLIMLKNALESTKKQLLRHKVRTFLAMIGVIIGIAAYVSAVCIGEGTRLKIVEDISTLGNSSIEVSIESNGGIINFPANDNHKSVGFSSKDFDAIGRIPLLHSSSPLFNEYAPIKYDDIRANANILGVNQNFFYIKNIELQSGQNFNEIIINEKINVVILGEYLAQKLSRYYPINIGNYLYIGKIPFKVIGITKEKSKGNSRTETAYIPYTTVAYAINPQTTQITNFVTRMTDDRYINYGIEKIKSVFAISHPEISVRVTSNDTYLQSLNKTTRTLDIFTYVISFVCLFVGGVCVTNTMLVSVNERLFEIGVRMAVGARPIDILVQFIAESFVICLIGGILGCILAIVLCYTINHFFPNMYYILLIKPFVLAFLFSSLVGILSGFYPARNASLRSPIQILNKE